MPSNTTGTGSPYATTATSSSFQPSGASVSPPKSPRKKSGNKLYNIPILKAFQSRYRENGVQKQSGEIGLEIECEGTKLFDAPIQYWQTHQDGSLRAVKGHAPVEYVLRRPIKRENVPKALTYLSTKLQEAGSDVVDSTRTSVHVHLNCQDLCIKQIYQIWCLYAIFEEMLVEFSGPDRSGNLFCLSGKQAEYNVYMLEQALRQENYNTVFDDNLRYTSCNFASVGKFGSLEFRSLKGTVDQALIQFWVDLLVMIKDKALEYQDPAEIVKVFQTEGPERFLVRTFGSRSDILQIFYNRQDRHQSMWDGLRMMRDVVLAVKWEKYDPSLEKKEDSQGQKAGSEQPWIMIGHHGIRKARKVIDADGNETRTWLIQKMNLRYYLANYLFDINDEFQWRDHSPGQHWVIMSRRMYQVNPITYEFSGELSLPIHDSELSPDVLVTMGQTAPAEPDEENVIPDEFFDDSDAPELPEEE